MDVIERAKIFSIAAHEAVGQVRKYTGEPYWTHPRAVADIVRNYGGTDEQVAAALLHDVVEDTDVGIDTIREHFGDTVADLVDWLTDVSKPEDGSRETRKALDRQHSADASKEAQFIKCADLIHNTESVVKHDEHFAKKYMREKRLLLEAMTKVHDEPIWQEAMDIVYDYERTRREEKRNE